MTTMLDPIIAATALRITRLPPLDDLVAAAAAQPPARDFAAALSAPGLSVIAEIKRRSPSAGDIDATLDPVLQAQMYETGGAAAISVLTEPDFFSGSMEDLVAVRSAVDLPVLRKDFTLDPRQVFEARSAGADAVLLIVAVLRDLQIDALLAAAAEAGVAAVVEVHSAAELERAHAAGASIIGVNNRNLATFDTDLAIAEALGTTVRNDSVVATIAESGVSDRDGAVRMRRAGYDAILVGEALVRAEDPAAHIAELRDEPV